jgi:hypothetical protein
VALRRNSIVRAALERVKSVVTLLRGIILAWWAGDLSLLHSFRDPMRDVLQDAASRRPQPLTMFPPLERLIVHEPWLADPAVRAQRMWQDEGWDGAHYAYFILTNGHMPALGILMRDDSPTYLRLHFNYAFAAVDGAMLAREIHHQPSSPTPVWGGVDAKRHCTWSVRVVQRDRRCEVQITTGGLIPKTYDYRRLEDAVTSAEDWATGFLHGEWDTKEHRDGGDKDHSERSNESQWLM